jgi:alanyl-tRNA synthetase
MTGNEIRAKFLEYFQSKGHKAFKSSPLIPAKDPTLLFVNAGMVPFKNVFLGQEDVGARRATSSQKCLRVSGKHNDFENVGRTARHHTFFEMLGNFSFGDYFKEDAIRFGYEFLVDWMELDPEKLWVTVFDDDDEAEELWQTAVGFPKERIVRMGEKDNFWSMGDTGPCGPCTEIHIDQGPAFGTGPEDVLGGEGDRYLEIWNLVFMQYDRDENGVLTPLPAPSVDTGMGLERLVAVMQGKATNYDSDLFADIHAHTEKISGKVYGADKETTVSMRVIADHIRSATFLIGDGVLPSNEGRGYVLRRIMRRALRHGVLIDIKEPFLYEISGTVIDAMRSAYPELESRRSYIAKILKSEEERFLRTLENGLKILNQEIENMREAGQDVLDGEFAFKLFDTYGFPLDLTEDIGRDGGFSVDNQAFNKSMEKQRESSAKGAKLPGEQGLVGALAEIAQAGVETEFIGYDTQKAKSQVLGLVVDNAQVETAEQGQTAQIIIEKTPFYAEMGGQVGDWGIIENKNVVVAVQGTFAPASHLIVHTGKIAKGRLAVGDTVELAVDPVRRADIQANHSATHLLHYALREVLGPDVKQAGSLVSPDRLRFDFTCLTAIETEELDRIERRVNALIRKNDPVASENDTYENAVKKGVVALFGEKYPDTVRVVGMGDAKELCGGTHVVRTGDIGPFVIVSEASIAAGVRRIEALTGTGAVEYIQTQKQTLAHACGLVKSTFEQLPEKTEKLVVANKALEKKVDELTEQLSAAKSGDVMDGVKEINGVKALAAKVDVPDGKALRTLAANTLDKIGSGVLALGAEAKGRALLIVLVTKDLSKTYNANNLIRPIAEAVGGKGGGRPDMAQAGGSDPANLEAALALLYDTMNKMGN